MVWKCLRPGAASERLLNLSAKSMVRVSQEKMLKGRHAV